VNLSSFIAKRYFLAKKSSNAVNIITGISVLGILVGTAALVIVLSAFNGLEQMVKNFYQAFDPELKVTPVSGKFFSGQAIAPAALQIDGIAACSYVLEEKALFTFKDREYIATLKGVDSIYPATNKITEFLRAGNYRLTESLPATPAVLGAGVAYYLGFSQNNFEEPVNLFIPKDYSGSDPSKSFAVHKIYPLGIFSVQPEFDEKYCFVPLPVLQNMLNRPDNFSALEISLLRNASLETVQEKLQARLGKSFIVKNQDEQQALFFKIMQTEGLFTFLIFALILAIATFTIAGSLTMLMFEKKENLKTLSALGLSLQSLRAIFFKEGLIISLTGGGIGLVLGIALVWMQQHFGLLAVGEGYIVEAYPVYLAWRDVALVSTTVLALSLTVSLITAQRLNYRLIR
jgi:lipoprotein-releasing system permease protein